MLIATSKLLVLLRSLPRCEDELENCTVRTIQCVLLYKVQSNLDTCVDTRKKASEHSYIRPSFDNYGRSLAGFVKDKVLGVSR